MTTARKTPTARPPAAQKRAVSNPKTATATKSVAKPRAAAKSKTAAKPAARKTATPTRRPATAARKAPARRKPATKPASLGPHEALYSGTTFRSRLEARWAIFFDVLGWDWDYEPSHYPVGDGLGYLPDFYLPRQGLWAEGKGPTFLDSGSMGKVVNAVAGPQPLPLRDPPYWPNNGLVLLGPMQPLLPGRVPVHTMLTASPAPSTAAAHLSTWSTDGLHVMGTEPWTTFRADGTKPARRPSPTMNARLLMPEPVRGNVAAPIRTAYETALSTTFAADGAALVPRTVAARILVDRRRGRPYRPGGVPIPDLVAA